MAIGHEITTTITITIINHVVVPFGFTIRTPIECEMAKATIVASSAIDWICGVT